jgi:hypothetical protein
VTPKNPDDREAAADLRELAATVIEGDLCSHLFPLFVACYQNDTGREPTAAVRQAAATIGAAHDREGVHYTSQEIARILCDRAARIERGGGGDGAV